MSESSGEIHISFGGDNKGQIAVGDKNIQSNSHEDDPPQGTDSVPRPRGLKLKQMINVARLREKMTQYFSLTEIQTIAFDMAIDSENLPRTIKEEFVRELIEHCRRTDRLEELVLKCYKLRPHAFG